MRLIVVGLVYLFLLVAIVVRLFYWQVIKNDQLTFLAEKQHLISLTLEAPRGMIYASDYSILAANKPTFLLYGLPKVVKDKLKVASKLQKVLSEDITEAKKIKDEIVAKLSEDLFWVPLKKDIDQAKKEQIEKLELSGIGFNQQLSRFYPEGSSSAHILGFVGLDGGGRQTGYFGVEGYYNGELKGVEGVVKEEKDARGLPILIGKFVKKEPKTGYGLILNIDRTVQFILERNLKEGLKKYGAKAASAIVVEPLSGNILAMVSYPDYEPGRYVDYPKENFKNPLVADSYEPGSTFKVAIMAAAINEGLITPESRCDECVGPLSIGGFLIRTWNNKYYPQTTTTETIVHSDNTGMVFVGKKLGVDKMYEYIKRFGFGDITKVDLQDEASPDIREKESWKEVDLATASFGQGIAVTAIQMVRAVTAIANGGKLMEPHIVGSIQTPERLINIQPKVVGNPISTETAKVITNMMVEAVEKGEAKAFKPKGFKIAGKTGTAQIPIAGRYDPNKTIASFVGFAPADNPKFVMLVRYDQPSSSAFGSETAAPTFFAIAKELFIYFNIAPDE